MGSTTATIEYAVGVLEVKNIIVCGHTDCGVVKALLDPKQVERLPAVKAWLGQAEQRAASWWRTTHLQGDALQVATIQEHVRSQVEHLQSHPTVAARPRKGFLHLHGWVYSIATGDIWAYDAKREIFASLDKMAA